MNCRIMVNSISLSFGGWFLSAECGLIKLHGRKTGGSNEQVCTDCRRCTEQMILDVWHVKKATAVESDI